MKFLLVVLLVFVLASSSLCATECSTFDVVSYGATGNGQTDDTKAFAKAWKDVCGATHQTAKLVIPQNKIFMLQPLSLKGPCNPATIEVRLEGTVIAPKSNGDWKFLDEKKKWIEFSDISGLVIGGGGLIDGQGAAWWNFTDVSVKPTALHFHNCKDVILRSMHHKNSPGNHISIDTCNGLEISHVHITAPMQSPNTDGIDISGSSNIFIHSSIIQTGDNCIAINSGTSFVNISDIFCGPGHGISVGSLGRNGDDARVENIHVRNCTFLGSTNGVRLKTWRGGRGYARKIVFEDIKVVGVMRPVIINQNYLGVVDAISAVKISDVSFRNVKGTTGSDSAVELRCDPYVGCNDIVLDHISIVKEDGGKAKASCTGAQGTCFRCNPIVPCLSDSHII
ncbi:probable polygalacturonase At3g15720 [Vigna radiata var. radiata]|uniref:Probable polygalacturonase At3g15720 n=1 Tax=Vigna radiata var. radiata TaxID=3916 RepID=A0A1S3VTH9_VIGRR|nr:probable polygalacturonase At3g15720 [Vigna radiata var. radiata]